MKQFFLGIILFVVSIVLIIPLGIWGLIETLIGLFYKKRWEKALNSLGDIFRVFAILVDSLGNVVMQFPFNRLLQQGGYKFGNYKDTISYALGMNQLGGTLTPTGQKLCDFLDIFEEDHCLKTVKRKIN